MYVPVSSGVTSLRVSRLDGVSRGRMSLFLYLLEQNKIVLPSFTCKQQNKIINNDFAVKFTK